MIRYIMTGPVQSISAITYINRSLTFQDIISKSFQLLSLTGCISETERPKCDYELHVTIIKWEFMSCPAQVSDFLFGDLNRECQCKLVYDFGDLVENVNSEELVTCRVMKRTPSLWHDQPYPSLCRTSLPRH